MTLREKKLRQLRGLPTITQGVESRWNSNHHLINDLQE